MPECKHEVVEVVSLVKYQGKYNQVCQPQVPLMQFVFALIMFPSVNWPYDARSLACVSHLFLFPVFCLLFESFFVFLTFP